jgi:hypothetical protein
MDAEVTKVATNRAIMANSILSMLNDTTTAIAAMLDELYQSEMICRISCRASV